MNKILEMFVEPEKLYTGSVFKLKVKIQPESERNGLTFAELRQLTFEEAKDNYTFEGLKGVENGPN